MPYQNEPQNDPTSKRSFLILTAFGLFLGLSLSFILLFNKAPVMEEPSKQSHAENKLPLEQENNLRDQSSPKAALDRPNQEPNRESDSPKTPLPKTSLAPTPSSKEGDAPSSVKPKSSQAKTGTKGGVKGEMTPLSRSPSSEAPKVKTQSSSTQKGKTQSSKDAPPQKSKVHTQSKKTATKPLMEMVETDATFAMNAFSEGDEILDFSDNDPWDRVEVKAGPKTKAPTVSKTKTLSLPSVNVDDTIDELLRDANQVANGFQETNSGEINGVWEGLIKVNNTTQFKIVLNRIWDHMTNDYLPTSCLAFGHVGKTTVGRLRKKTLEFYEKPGKRGRTKLIAKIKDQYVFEIDSPNIGSSRTTGKAYSVSRNKKLIPLGTISITKDSAATADTDCAYFD